MLIQPMAATYAMGEIGRSTATMGGKGGPASFFSPLRDEVTLSGKPRVGAGLYSGSPLFKIMGAVELVRGDAVREDMSGEAGAF